MRHLLKSRAERRYQFEARVREHFNNEGFLETRTPLLVQSPGMEPHICPIEVKRKPAASPVFLPTSPEFAMKKLLALGLNRIFQICSSFRDEPESPEHQAEFTMLEFYETETSLERLMERVENLFKFLQSELHPKKEHLIFRDQKVNFQASFPRLRVVDLFQTHLGVDLRSLKTSHDFAAVCKTHHILANENEDRNDLYFKLWLNLIEPKLPKNQVVFVTHYPLEQSSLCNPILDEKGYAWANRFEVYLGNFELGNAFDELRDPEVQKKNFIRDQEVRKSTYGDRYPESPLDLDLLQAIAQMKPTCGIALGLDRLAMIFLEASTIEEVLPLKSYWH